MSPKNGNYHIIMHGKIVVCRGMS